VRDHLGLLASSGWIWRHPRAEREKLIGFQSRRLRRLLRHAYQRVPFYRDWFDAAGIRVEDVAGPGDLEALPILSKRDLRANSPERMITRGTTHENLLVRKTSGSSGNPFSIRRTTAEDRLLFLFRLRTWLQVGIRPRDHLATVIESRPTDAQARTPWARFQRASGILRTDRLDGLRPADELADELEHLAPDVLLGYPSTLASLAATLARRPASRLRPRLILSGGESLREPVRRQIEAAFAAAAVFDLYGAYEFNLLAWQCPASGKLHICEDNVILEVLRDGRPALPGEPGEVVVTGLHGYTAPFIRYRIGDIAMRVAGSCACGQPFAMLEAIQGRTVEYFRLPDGRWIHPYLISGPLIEHQGEWIDRHQLTQETGNRVILRIAPRRPPPEGALASIRRVGEAVLGRGTDFAIEIVEALHPAPGGKFHPYRSKLVGPHAEPDWTRPDGE
jgi:phenylacetate-CoA ligase